MSALLFRLQCAVAAVSIGDSASPGARAINCIHLGRPSSSYYRAQVRIDAERAKTHPNPKLVNVALKPGMTATVDVRTGHRSVLKYLAKPVYKAFGGALNER